MKRGGKEEGGEILGWKFKNMAFIRVIFGWKENRGIKKYASPTFFFILFRIEGKIGGKTLLKVN